MARGGAISTSRTRGMVDTIILLTGAAEQEALTTLLKRHNARLTVHLVDTLEALDAIEPRLLRRARLLAFLTSVIVPQRILERLGYGAYNFHPGPPNYPGWVPSHFAVYDAGDRFRRHRACDDRASRRRTDRRCRAVRHSAGHRRVRPRETGVYGEPARLIWRLAPALATQREPLEPLPIRLVRAAQHAPLYEAMCDIPPDISARRIGAPNRRLRRRPFRHPPDRHGERPRVPLREVEGRKLADTRAGAAAGARAGQLIAPATNPFAKRVAYFSLTMAGKG